MKFAVRWGDETVGTVEVVEEAAAVLFTVDCAGEWQNILRCYGETNKKPLLIGVLEPKNGGMCCTRRISRQSLLQQCGEALPNAFFLDDGQSNTIRAGNTKDEAEKPLLPALPALWTGDALLDKAMMTHASDISVEERKYGLRIRCLFSQNQPFALAFAAPSCQIENIDGMNFAIYDYKGRYYCEGKL